MVVSQTYLVAQITVEQIYLNLADEINSLKLKNFKFRGNRSIFVRTERLNTIVTIFFIFFITNCSHLLLSKTTQMQKHTQIFKSDQNI